MKWYEKIGVTLLCIFAIIGVAHAYSEVNDIVVHGWLNGTSANFSGNITTQDSMIANKFWGEFNWTTISGFLSFTGSLLDFDSNKLNMTIVTLINSTPTGNTSSELTAWIQTNRSKNVVFGENVTAYAYLNASNSLDWINPENVFDIDKEDIETDLNTFVDIAGDTMTGDLNISGGGINATKNSYFGENLTIGTGNANIEIGWNGTNLILKGNLSGCEDGEIIRFDSDIGLYCD